MRVAYKFIESINHLPLDRFEVKPDASIFESWEFLRLGTGDSAQFFCRAKPGNPQARGKQLRLEIDLLDWQNQDRSKTYVAMAHQLDFTRQTEYIGSISKCDVSIPVESYSFELDSEADQDSWDGSLLCELPEDAAVTMEICHVQGQDLNATASVKMGWQGKFYVMVRVLVDRDLMQTLVNDISSGKYERLTTSVSITPWRPVGDSFNNLLPLDQPLADDEGYDFPHIVDTRCSDMFRFTFMPRDQEGQMMAAMEDQSQQLKSLVNITRTSQRLRAATSALLVVLLVVLVIAVEL